MWATRPLPERMRCRQSDSPSPVPKSEGPGAPSARLGRVTETGATRRITIRLDEDLVDHFLKEAEASGGATGYQTLINQALRQHVEGKAPKLEETLRRVLREEMRAAS